MLELINKTGTTSRIGFAVILDPTDNQSFIYAPHGSTRVLGIVTQSVRYRSKCKIATQGEKAQVYVSANAVKDNIIRLSKTADRISFGASTVAKSSDAPYLKIGTALNAGRGLIECQLDLLYLSNPSTSGGITTPTSYPYTVTLTDNLIVCDSAVAVTVNLPIATGSSREIQIANINIGNVTIVPNGADTINGEVSQIIHNDSCMDIKDYAVNKWVII